MAKDAGISRELRARGIPRASYYVLRERGLCHADAVREAEARMRPSTRPGNAIDRSMSDVTTLLRKWPYVGAIQGKAGDQHGQKQEVQGQGRQEVLT